MKWNISRKVRLWGVPIGCGTGCDFRQALDLHACNCRDLHTAWRAKSLVPCIKTSQHVANVLLLRVGSMEPFYAGEGVRDFLPPSCTVHACAYVQKVSVMHMRGCRLHAGQVWSFCIWLRSLASLSSLAG